MCLCITLQFGFGDNMEDSIKDLVDDGYILRTGNMIRVVST